MYLQRNKGRVSFEKWISQENCKNKNSLTKIKFAIVGIGHIGKRHIAMVEANSDCELVAICDTKPQEELGLKNINVPYFNSIQDLISTDLDFEVLNICTPNGLHAEQAILALR